jgi:glucose uptake protein GlcU
MQGCGPNDILTDFGCIPNDPVGFVERFYGIGLGLVGLVALIFIIVGGYFIMTSQGDPSKLQIGKSYITYSIVGVLLAIFGFVFIEVITGDILQIPGFN